ncbi:MAG TPA: ribokinase [Acidobacteriaceae bacterium]|jgi:ribokinase
MTKPIIVVGSINLDLVVGADRIPKVGETVAGKSFNTYFGGKGANQAVAAAKLGYPVAMVGCVGTDPFGEQLRKGLHDAGVDTVGVRTVEGSSGVALITTGSHGENNIVVVPGANGHLEPAALNEVTPLLESAGMLLVQLEIPLDTVEYVAQLAERNNIPLMLDPAPARDLPSHLLSRVLWITPNETEIQELLQRRIDSEGDYYAAADSLLSRGTKNVLLKMGSRGALVAQQDGRREIVPAFSVTPVDTTAAGDAFNSGFAVGLMKGMNPIESARFASAVAAISVTRAGAQPSMPALDEVERFIAGQSTLAR